MSSDGTGRRTTVKFRTTIAQTGNNTGLLVPAEIVTALGAGNRAKAGAAGGDEAATRQRRIDTAIAQLVGDSSAARPGDEAPATTAASLEGRGPSPRTDRTDAAAITRSCRRRTRSG